MAALITSQKEGESAQKEDLTPGANIVQSKVSATAQALISLYDQPFGGKDRGRFQISKRRLADLSGHVVLTSSFLSELACQLAENGYFLLDRNDYLVVLAATVTRNYRRVPDELVETFGNAVEEEAGSGEDHPLGPLKLRQKEESGKQAKSAGDLPRGPRKRQEKMVRNDQ